MQKEYSIGGSRIIRLTANDVQFSYGHMCQYSTQTSDTKRMQYGLKEKFYGKVELCLVSKKLVTHVLPSLYVGVRNYKQYYEKYEGKKKAQFEKVIREFYEEQGLKIKYIEKDEFAWSTASNKNYKAYVVLENGGR